MEDLQGIIYNILDISGSSSNVIKGTYLQTEKEE